MMNYIMPIILILASGGMFFGYINPTYTAVTGSSNIEEKSITELQSEEKDYTDALVKTAGIERIRTGLAAKFDKIDPEDQKKIEKMLPDHIDSVRLIIDINNIGAKYGMSLNNILLTASGVVPAATSKPVTSSAAPAPDETLSVGPDGSVYNSIKLGFTITGSYGNFIQFLKELEESLRVVDVTSLSFGVNKNVTVTSGQSGSGASDMYTYNMTIRTYYLK